MADGNASPWRMMWLGAILALIVLATGALPALTLAQDEGGDGGQQGAAEEPEEPAAPAETAEAESEDDDGEDADDAKDANGDAVEITTVTKTEVTKSTVSSQTADGKISDQKLSETYEKTVTTGTLPAGGAGGAAGGGGDGDGIPELDYMLDQFETQYTTKPSRPDEEEDFVDFSDFVTDSIDLYYYPDVIRLMQVLNPRAYPVGGLKNARDQLNAARKQLDEAEKLVEAKRKAEAEAGTDVSGKSHSIIAAANKISAEQAELKRLQDEEVRYKQIAEDKRTQDQKDRLSKLPTEISDQQQKLSEAENAKTQLDTEYKAAYEALCKAREELNKARSNALVAAEIESMAYGFARDNQPFWVAPAHATQNEEANPWMADTDPVNKVFMFAFEDRSTIILRGEARDIFEAKQVIKHFDVPAPQARLTLWTLEMNSKATPKGTRQLNEAMGVIEQELNMTRTQIDAVLSILKDVISEEVNRVATSHRLQGQGSAGGGASVTANPDSMLHGDARGSDGDTPPFTPNGGPNGSDGDTPPDGGGATWQQSSPANGELAGCGAFVRAADEDPRLWRFLYYEPQVLDACWFSMREAELYEQALREVAAGQEETPTHGSVERSFPTGNGDGEAYSASQAGDPGISWVPPVQINAMTGAQPGANYYEEKVADYFGLMPNILPDPAAVSTLGEAMLVLCLGSPESRKNIFLAFQNNLQGYLQWLCENGYCNCKHCAAGKPGFGDCCCDCEACFYRTIRAFGMDEYAGLPEDMDYDADYNYGAYCAAVPNWPDEGGGLNGKQAVIVSAIKRSLARDLLGTAGALLLHVDQVELEVYQLEQFSAFREVKEHGVAAAWFQTTQELKHDYGDVKNFNLTSYERSQARKATTERYGHLSTYEIDNVLVQSDETLGCIEAQAQPIQAWLANELGANGTVIRDSLKRSFSSRRDNWLRSNNTVKRGSTQQFDHDQCILSGILDQVYAQYVGNNEHRQVARADQLLKELNKAMEDDIDAEFIQPMLCRLREQLMNRGVAVGALQRTSMLTTNRKESRIVPVASAELRMGEEVNYLEEVQTLYALIEEARSGQLPQVVDSISELIHDEDHSEIYGITSGNTFVVTPLFDPTGQAYRFQLDHVYSNRIRDPDGSDSRTSIGLPRIERTTLNTEVQLSNFELREAGRFESNVKLGQPERRTGGLPLFKHDPLLRDIPLIGYFTRSRGEAAVTQRNIIFAQTTMYPTIDEIVPLMTTPLFVVSDRQY